MAKIAVIAVIFTAINDQEILGLYGSRLHAARLVENYGR